MRWYRASAPIRSLPRPVPGSPAIQASQGAARYWPRRSSRDCSPLPANRCRSRHAAISSAPSPVTCRGRKSIGAPLRPPAPTPSVPRRSRSDQRSCWAAASARSAAPDPMPLLWRMNSPMWRWAIRAAARHRRSSGDSRRRKPSNRRRPPNASLRSKRGNRRPKCASGRLSLISSGAPSSASD